jgi:hypothetical protein
MLVAGQNPILCGAPEVAMMETTNFGQGADGSARRRLDGARLGRVFVERQMRSTAMVVVHVCPEPPLKVPLV